MCCLAVFLNSILSIVNSVNILFSLFHLSPFPSFSIPGVFFSFCGCFLMYLLVQYISVKKIMSLFFCRVHIMNTS